MDQPIVTIKNGKLRGSIAKDYDGVEYYSFQGIPYTKPPVGSLRFKAPLPAESWNDIRNATENGNECICSNPFTKSICGSEDCLYLNVYTRELPDENKPLRPVMFSIHGGGFVLGSGSSTGNGPDFLITKDVVVVTINYRLGLLGYLNFEDPSLEVTGNAGLKDQVMALKWVKENITKFNGDPNNVTVFGISAGGVSAHYLMLSPLAKGLFHKVIMQSGSAFVPWGKGHRSLPYVSNLLDTKTTNEKEVLEILQNMSATELIEFQNALPDDYEASFRRFCGPVVENKSAKDAFLTENPEDIINSGNYNHVPVIAGFTSREGIFADVFCKESINGHVTPNFENKVPFYMEIVPETKLFSTVVHKIKTFYYADHSPSEENKNQYYMLQGDVAFVWPVIKAVNQHITTSKFPIYLYKFSADTGLNNFKKMLQITQPGAAHGDDLGYLYKHIMTPVIIPNSVEELTMKRFITLWTNFAKYGNPNSPMSDPLINRTWKPVTKDTLHYLEIGENLTTGINPEENRMQFWKDIASLKTK